MNSYIALSRLVSYGYSDSHPLWANYAMIEPVLQEHTATWESVHRIVDKVQKQVCGHALHTDMKNILIHTNLWTPQVQHSFATVVAECLSCKAAEKSPPNRRVSLATLKTSLDEVI